MQDPVLTTLIFAVVWTVLLTRWAYQVGWKEGRRVALLPPPRPVPPPRPPVVVEARAAWEEPTRRRRRARR